MKIDDALVGIDRLYIETTPLIYLVERNVTYIERVRSVIRKAESDGIQLFSSVISLTEVLTHPIRLGESHLEDAYRRILLDREYLVLNSINIAIAERAAQLRARYNLRTPDALHLATAMDASCEAFLTNDLSLKRVAEIRVLALDDLEI